MKPVIIWGGVDINPAIYLEEPLHGYVQKPSNQRDKEEIAQINQAIKSGTPIIGVCRGAQLICALEGGKLIQHSIPDVNNHPLETKEGIRIPSTPSAHHQIMVPKGDFELLAWDTGHSKVLLGLDDMGNEQWDVAHKTPEIIWYPKIKAFCVQGHPEWGGVNTPFVNYIDKKLEEFGIDFSFNMHNSYDRSMVSWV